MTARTAASAALLLCVAIPAAAQVTLRGATYGGLTIAGSSTPQGYVSRPAGFDLDRDGVFGEVGVDDQICDGQSGTGIESETLYGTTYEQIYVDCASGTDNGSCGGPDNPCLTLDYAADTRGDGAGDGNPDAVCFKGTCTPGNDWSFSNEGVASTYTVAQSGNFVRAWSWIPDEPFLLSGWDGDGDGSYPPHDTDDTSVIDGNGSAIVFGFDGDHIELAHFTVEDYGDSTSGGFFRNSDGSNRFVHDVVVDGVNQDQPLNSAVIIFEMWTSGDGWWIHNSRFLNVGGYFARGAPGNTGASPCVDMNPYRFSRLDVTSHGQDDEGMTFFKVWGCVQGLGIYDSMFDGNGSAWQYGTGNGEGVVGVLASQCSQDWDVVGNLFRDVTVGVSTQPNDASCTNRDMDEVRVHANTFDLDADATDAPDGAAAITISGGGALTVQNLDVTDNVITSDNFGACLFYALGKTGSAPTGTVTITGNSCAGDPFWPTNDNAMVWLDEGNLEHQNWVFESNTFAGCGSGELNVDVEFDPGTWICSAASTFDADCNYYWNGSTETTVSGYNADSGCSDAEE